MCTEEKNFEKHAHSLCCRQFVGSIDGEGDTETYPEGKTQKHTFSVISYNILAECHRQRGEYGYTEDEFLVQEYRHNLLMKELQYLNGDVICLQEVSPDYFNTVLMPAMKMKGYDGVFKCRTKEEYEEGEATFFKTEIFKFDCSKGVSLTEVVISEIGKQGLSGDVSAAIANYLDHADVVLIVRLQCKNSGRMVTIGNVHLWWEDNLHPDVKSVQAACAIKEVVGMAGSEGAYIICGDFNSECSSPIYQLVLDGHLSDSSIHTLQAVQRLELYDGTKSLVDYFKAAMRHPALSLKSAYSFVMGAEPDLTCYTNSSYTLDYIFFDSRTIVPCGILGCVNKETVFASGGLPSKDFPSDHLSLKAHFAFL